MNRQAPRAILAAALVATLAGVAPAQVVVTPPPAGPPGPTVEGQESEGQVTRINPADRTITLDTGAEYVVPETLASALAVVTEGASVKLRYDVDGGRNIVRQIQVTPR
jgi:hypothetical protein